MHYWLMLVAACSGAPTEIAFVSGTEQEDRCVCVLDVESGAVRRVGAGDRDGAPVWSPDGAWLAFQSKQPDGMGVRVVRADGSDGRALAHQHVWNHAPAWAPDGRRLAYTADADMGMVRHLMVYDLETDTETRWAEQTLASGFFTPVWMPNLLLMTALNPEQDLELEGVDTAALLAEAEAEGALLAIGLVGEPGALSTEIFLATSGQAAPLLPLLTPDSHRYAEWAVRPSGDGERIAFESNDGGDRELFIINKRGLADVTNHRAADWNPVWSNDDKWLAFESFRGGRRGVYRLFSDTARVFPVAAGPDHANWAPAWSPDDDCIAFVSDRSGDPELYLFEIDSGVTRRLTEHAGPDLAPAWRPEVRK